MNVDRVAAMVSSIAVGIAVIFGLLIVGSPGEQRLYRFDEARLEDLQHLARVIDAYWRDHEALPATLSVLVDGRRLSELPRDPATEASYEYAATAANGYELCATFELPSANDQTPQFWQHTGGRTCYEFDVVQRTGTSPG